MRGGGPGGALGLGSLSLGGRRMRGAAGGGLSAYAVNGNDPATVADFAGVLNSGTPYFRKAGSDSTFSGLFTHARSSNATMTDSDGNLKWAPHNLLTYSEDFTNAAWTDVGTTSTVTANATPAPDGSMTADRWTATGASTLSQSFSPDIAFTATLAVWVKSAGTGADTFRLYVANNKTSANLTATSEWQLFTLSNGSDFLGAEWGLARDSSNNPVDIYLWGAHVYRSDLGGMVNNWDRSPADSYVPTTSAAVYLLRRNHYRYNGTSYVKKGILLESAAATNLITQSNDLSTTWIQSATNRLQLGTAGTGLDGVSGSAQLIEIGSDAGSKIRAYAIDISSTASEHAFSTRLKDAGGGSGWVALATQDATAGVKYSYFDLANGVKGTTATGHTTYMAEVAPGWYECVVVNTYASTTTQRCWIVLATSDGAQNVDTATYPQGTQWCYHYQSQCELGSINSSVIPTSGATATRAAETLQVAGADMAYSATAMSFQMQGEINYADDGVARSFYSWVTSANDNIRVYLQTAGSPDNFLLVENDDGGVTSTISSAGNTFTPGVAEAYNFAHYVNVSDINAAVDGTALTAGGAGGSPDISTATFAFGTNGSIPNYAGTIALFRQWDVDLLDAGIEAAST